MTVLRVYLIYTSLQDLVEEKRGTKASRRRKTLLWLFTYHIGHAHDTHGYT